MATGTSKQLKGSRIGGGTIPYSKTDGRLHNARGRDHVSTIDLADAVLTRRNSGDDNALLSIPVGRLMTGGTFVSSVTLNTTQVSIGTRLNPTKFMSAQVYTTPDVPINFGRASALAADPLDVDEDVFLFFTVANAPAVGIIGVVANTVGV